MAVVASLVAAWQVPAGATAAAPVTVKLGAVLPLSGAEGSIGQAQVNGAQLAVDQANGNNVVPGVKFTLAPKSDVGTSGLADGSTGAAQVRSLIADGQVAGYVGPFDTTTALSELPLANRAPLAAVSPSAGDTCLTVSMALGCTAAPSELAAVQPTGHTTFFRVATSDSLQPAALADFAFTTRFFHNVAVIDDTSAIGAEQAIEFANRFRLDGGSTTTVSVAPTTSYVNLLTQLAAKKPDAIAYFDGTSAGASAGLLVRQQMLQIPGLKNTAFLSTAPLHTNAAAQPLGALGGSVFTTAPAPQPGQLPSAAQFVTAFTSRFGAVTPDALRGYDAAEALLHAIQGAVARGAHPPTSSAASATSFRRAVIAALVRTSFAGAEGTISFAANGDLQQGPIEIDTIGTTNPPTWVPVTVATGTTPTPSVALSPLTVLFGDVLTHGGSATATVTVANSGVIPFPVGTVSVAGSGYKLVGNTCTANLVAGTGCSLTVSFTPPSVGKFGGTISVSDPAAGSPQTVNLAGFGVNPATLVITTTTLRRGAVGVPYHGTLAAIGGVSPYHWSVSAGKLPGGLTLGAKTGALTGTPTSPGSSTVTFKATDSATTAPQSATVTLTLVIAPPVPAAVYVGNGGNSSVHAFSLPPTINPSPLITLAGNLTQLDGTSGVATDGTGGLDVSNVDSESITEYAPGANGNMRPSTVISGPDTGIAYPAAVAVDADGFIYVANHAAGTVTVYAPDSSGDARPARTISGLFGPDALAFDTAGNLWVAEADGNTVARFAHDADGQAAPSVTIKGADTNLDYPSALALDQAGHVLVANEFASTITIYNPSGNPDAGPVGTIGGGLTGLDFPVGLDLDAHGNIYASNMFANDITVYPAGTMTGVGPMATISGNNTGLAAPQHLAVTPPFTILNRKLAAARVGRSYHVRLWAAFGLRPYRWSLRSGRLPGGLRLDGRTGVISGTPRHRAVVRVRVRVRDHGRRAVVATRSLTLRVR